MRARGWRLFTVDNLKLARFKEIIPAAAKSDRIGSITRQKWAKVS